MTLFSAHTLDASGHVSNAYHGSSLHINDGAVWPPELKAASSILAGRTIFKSLRFSEAFLVHRPRRQGFTLRLQRLEAAWRTAARYAGGVATPVGHSRGLCCPMN